MNKIQESIKEKQRAIIVVILFISCLCAGFSMFIVFHSQKDINEKIDIHVHNIKAFIGVVEKITTISYRNRIRSFIDIKGMPVREEILQAFARRDRQELLRLSQPFFKLFKEEKKDFSTFAWILPDNRAFLRVHEPKSFGDDLSGIRPDIVKANRELIQTYGYLAVHSGLDYRIVQPVNYKGEHLGLVQFSFKEYYLIDTMGKELAIPVAQVMDREKFEKITSFRLPYQHSGTHTVQSRDLDLIKSAETEIDWNLVRQQVVLAGREHRIVRVFRLPNYADETEGWIFALIDVSDYIIEMRASIIKIVLVSVLLIVFSFFFVSKSYGRLVDKITRLNRSLTWHNIVLEERVMQRTHDLHNEQEKLFVTLRSIGDGVITTDIEGRITFINIIAETLTGWSQQEAVGQLLAKVFNIINEKTGLTCKDPVAKVLASGKIVGLANHTALITKDGIQRSIADSAAPIFDPDEKIIGVALVFRDITQEKRIEEELLKIKKLESVGVLAGGIAHDFNNILTAILGNINLAAMYIEKENQAYPLLREAEKASIRAKGLTQQLLTFAKGGNPVRKATSIKQVIIDSADFVLRGSNVTCRYSIPENLWLVDVDTGQMSQVIQNLIINARYAMPDGGEIDIVCVNITDIIRETALSLPGEKYIKIIIKDNGGGIPEKYINKIFDPYFSTKQVGSGLGLAVTHSIINKHDGHIVVLSKPGEGTTFTIYLPASVEQIIRDLTIVEVQKIKKNAKYTILIMDDEQLIQDVVKQMFSYLGHEILQAKDGNEAIDIYQEHYNSDKPIDVIIMDLTIPGGMGGEDAIKKILKIDSDAKVVVSSGYSNDPVMANYREYGFKASLRKPFEMAELNKIINSVLT